MNRVDLFMSMRYCTERDLLELRTKAYAFLDEKRIAHVAGCETEAVRLAEKYGADVCQAATAAILHDITKKLDLSNQLILCERYGIICDVFEKNNASLLHARTGACKALELFDIEQPVFDAIRWHTTGRPDMALLEKILYLADYIEPTRCFEGIDRLRKSAYENLDSALSLGLKMSIEDVRSRGYTLHPVSVEAYEYYKEKDHA